MQYSVEMGQDSSPKVAYVDGAIEFREINDPCPFKEPIKYHNALKKIDHKNNSMRGNSKRRSNIMIGS